MSPNDIKKRIDDAKDNVELRGSGIAMSLANYLSKANRAVRYSLKKITIPDPLYFRKVTHGFNILFFLQI